MAPNAKNGPKGICIFVVFFPEQNKKIMPDNEPRDEAITIVIHHPSMPQNAPINESSSISPWPMPTRPVNQ